MIKDEMFQKVFIRLLMVFCLTVGLASASMAEPPGDSQPVNINQANALEIATNLKGIGLKRAEAIVAWREEYGDFGSADELVEVKGVGESTLEKNRHLILLE